MSIELQLVRQYLAAHEVAVEDLPNARAILDAAIAETPAEIVPEGACSEQRPGPGRQRRRRVVWAAGVALLVVALGLIAVPWAPAAKIHRPLAASAEIARLADAIEPAAPLQPGQWLAIQQSGEIAAQVSNVGNTPTPDARASDSITIDVWSNSSGTTCTSQQFGTATFASPANAQAWQSIGLIATPNNQPVTGCVAGVEAANGGGQTTTPINVASLTHSPSTLANELQDGTTGISSIDQSARGATTQQDVFGRLVTLLVGPSMGSWPGFDQELLHTMAILPGVISLGKMTAHSGLVGLSFSTPDVAELNPRTGAVTSTTTSPVVILNPATGTLLEARNFSIPVLQNAAQDFVGSPNAPVYTEGVGYGISTTWIDPVQGPGVIADGGLPTWITGFHVIEAVGNPNVNLQTMADVFNEFVGTGNSLFDDPQVPGSSQTTFDLTIPDTGTDVNTVVAALNASGLFQSVTVKA